MAIITKFTTMEYGQNSELSEGDCSRYDARKLPVVKDLNCTVYEMKKILGHNQNIDEAATVTHAFEGHVRQTVEHWTNSSYPYTTTTTTIPNLVQARVGLRIPWG